MIKYVLNSGGIKNAPKLKKQFYQELVKGLGNNPQVFAVQLRPRKRVLGS